MKRILIVFGTRPEVIKLAPLVHALRARPDAVPIVCATGQHRAMLDAACRTFSLEPDLDLGLMQPRQHPADLLGRALMALRPVLEERRPDVVVVQGDTITVMAAALAGFLHNVDVAHVEAGLRTRDKRAPFPEEIDRRVAGVVADWHFTPTSAARDNLLREGIPAETITVTGNTGIDALLWMKEQNARIPPALPEFASDRRLVLVTAHRRESFGAPLRELCAALRTLVERYDDVELVYPVHLNPQVREPVHELLGDQSRVHLLEPLDYAQMVALMQRARLILTDSGGVQEEAPALGTPVLVLRDKTERPEAIAAGVARLVGMDANRILDEAGRLLTDPGSYDAMATGVSPYGDGRAAQRIAEVLCTGTLQTPAFDAT